VSLVEFLCKPGQAGGKRQPDKVRCCYPHGSTETCQGVGEIERQRCPIHYQKASIVAGNLP
jgi:hypothetical protein